LADIAQACGVTKATVSRVLNAKPGFTVRQEVQDKIHDAANRLNYRPSGLARSLRSNKVPMVIVLGFHPHWMNRSGPTIYGDLIDSVRNELTKQNTACFLDLATDDDRSPEWASLVPDSAVVIPPLTDLRYDKLTRDRIPFVLVNEKGQEDVSCVYTDDHAGARLAVDHLVALGHKRIAYLNQSHLAHGYEYHSSLPDRMNGYVDAMHHHGLPTIPGYDQPLQHEDFFQQIVLPHRPTAIISYKTASLKFIHDLAQSHGMVVPRDLSLIGFDNIEPLLASDFAYTVIEVPMLEMGHHAARIIGMKLRNPNYHEQLLCEETLIIRQSTAPAKD
jgi:LacI family transcriptional regulator